MFLSALSELCATTCEIFYFHFIHFGILCDFPRDFLLDPRIICKGAASLPGVWTFSCYLSVTGFWSHSLCGTHSLCSAEACSTAWDVVHLGSAVSGPQPVHCSASWHLFDIPLGGNRERHIYSMPGGQHHPPDGGLRIHTVAPGAKRHSQAPC